VSRNPKKPSKRRLEPKSGGFVAGSKIDQESVSSVKKENMIISKPQNHLFSPHGNNIPSYKLAES
jgi:hypothetical protein